MGAAVSECRCGLSSPRAVSDQADRLDLKTHSPSAHFAHTWLHDYVVHHGNEQNLQSLIERFPWIVEPDIVNGEARHVGDR